MAAVRTGEYSKAETLLQDYLSRVKGPIPVVSTTEIHFLRQKLSLLSECLSAFTSKSYERATHLLNRICSETSASLLPFVTQGRLLRAAVRDLAGRDLFMTAFDEPDLDRAAAAVDLLQRLKTLGLFALDPVDSSPDHHCTSLGADFYVLWIRLQRNIAARQWADGCSAARAGLVFLAEAGAPLTQVYPWTVTAEAQRLWLCMICENYLACESARACGNASEMENRLITAELLLADSTWGKSVG
jgi:hypothetical protein